MTPTVTTFSRAFTLVELMITVAILAIATAIVAPALSDDRDARIAAAAWILQSDIEFAQTSTIAHPDRPTVVRLAADGTGWSLALASNRDAAIPDGRGGRYRVVCGEGRARAARGVRVEGVQLEGDVDLVFSELGGVVDFTRTPAILLEADGAALALVVSPHTGEIELVDDPERIAALRGAKAVGP